MLISSIIKKEYYDSIVVIDLNELSHAEYINDIAAFYFKNNGCIELIRNAKDANNDLKKMFLDLYSSWRKYSENINIITQVMESQ